MFPRIPCLALVMLTATYPTTHSESNFSRYKMRAAAEQVLQLKIIMSPAIKNAAIKRFSWPLGDGKNDLNLLRSVVKLRECKTWPKFNLI